MMYLLLYPLRGSASWLGWLNVLRYVPFRAIMATLTAMVMSFALGPWFIQQLKQKQIGQVVRSDGPESHFSKRGTPTMGGSLLIFTLTLSTVLWADTHNSFVWLTLFVTVSYGVVGFLDDYLKIRWKNPAETRRALQARGGSFSSRPSWWATSSSARGRGSPATGSSTARASRCPSWASPGTTSRRPRRCISSSA